MSELDDQAIEALLREQFEGPVRDDGFGDRVMQHLPPRRRRVTWPLWAGLLVGVVACWLGLLDAPLLRVGWGDWVRADWSVPACAMLLVVAAISLLALCWGVDEPGTG